MLTPIKIQHKNPGCCLLRVIYIYMTDMTVLHANRTVHHVGWYTAQGGLRRVSDLLEL